jgi:hypothetical protein
MEDEPEHNPYGADIAPPFSPVPLQRHRHDGWTPERQRAFIQVLTVTGQVSTACRAVGMSRKAAYKLLERPDAESFARAWQAALTEGRQRMLDQLMARTINGVTTIMVKAGGAVEIGHGPDGRLMAGFLKSPPPGEDRFQNVQRLSRDNSAKGDLR